MFLFMFCLLLIQAGKAQNVGINSGGSTPNSSAILDLNTGNTLTSPNGKGLLIPNVALTGTGDAVTVSSPATSLLVYNTATAGSSSTAVYPGYYYWNGTKWVALGGTNGGLAWSLTGNAGTTAGTNFIGTTDAIDWVIKTNNIERARVFSSGDLAWGASQDSRLQLDQGGSIELGGNNSLANTVGGGVPYLDFHYGSGAVEDYNVRIVNAAASRLDFTTLSGGTAMTINSNKVGVGTTAPSYLFHATGNQANIGYFTSTSGTGTGMAAGGNNLTPLFFAGGAGGSFISSNVGVLGYGNTTAGATGLYGVAANSSGFGALGWNVNASGTGVIGAGNNLASITYLAAGSGGSFCGSSIGLVAYKDGALTNGQGAGWFIASTTSNVGVAIAFRNAGTNYKIINVGAFGGAVSTDVWGVKEGDRRIMFCPEAPEILLQDFGKGQLANGKVHIDLDPIYARNILVNQDHPLQVYIQLEGDCKGVFVTSKTQNGFDVVELQSGNSNAPFTWFVSANRADYVDPKTGELISKHDGVRFPVAPDAPEPKTFKPDEAKSIKR